MNICPRRRVLNITGTAHTAALVKTQPLHEKDTAMKYALVLSVAFGALMLAACGGGTSEDYVARCGNRVIDPGEICDGNNVGIFTCEQLGFGPGILLCEASCTALDTARCSASATCGDNAIDGSDVCDGTDLGRATCETQGYGAGTLTCQSNCAGFDVSGCGPAVTCGNNKLDTGEACDGALLNGRTCGDYDFEGGQLACNDSCTDFDTSGCTGGNCEPQCGGRECGPDPVCGESCGTCGDFERCTEDGQCERTCDLEAIETPRNIDIDLITVQVGGTITLNGAQMPDNTYTYDRGYIRFTNTSTNDYYNVSLKAASAASFNAELFAGTYDIMLYPNDGGDQTVLPPVNIVLEKGRVIETLTELNYDLRTVDVGGTVTLNGARMPDNTYTYDRGVLRFYNTESNDYLSVSLKSTGAATYNLTVFAGTWDIRLYPGSSGDQTVLPDAVMVLRKGVTISQVQQLDFNPETVMVGGSVTLNGAQMPDNTYTYNRGELRFYRKDTGDYLSVSLKSTGAAVYNVEVFEGDYDVKLYPADASDQTVLPAINLVLLKDVSVTATLAQDFNLETVPVGGTVTLNGAQMPDNSYTYDRGALRFYNKKSADYLSVSLKSTGAATYNTTVFKGLYDVKLYPNSAGDQTVLPDLNIRVGKNVDIQTVQELNYDAKTVMVGGTVTLNGAQMPGNTYTYDRGWLRFVYKDGSDYLDTSLGSTGPATYNAELFAGVYDVFVNPNDKGDQTVLPPVRIKVHTGCAAISSDCALDAGDISGTWDVAAESPSWGTWTFTITQNGDAVGGSFVNWYNQSGEITEGSRSGNDIDFIIQPYCTVQVHATVVNGCVMTGWMRDISCGNTDPFTNWIGERLP